LAVKAFFLLAAGTLAVLLPAISVEARDARRSNLGAGDVAAVQTSPRKDAIATDGDFGAKLAAVARRQTSHFVFYNPAYMKIAYPMGDVPSYFGVCTDVVVRAYRALGIDLQVQVHKSGAGSGDTNIDHRRVEVLRSFFARAGTTLPITAKSRRLQAGRHRHVLHAERLALQDAHRHSRRRKDGNGRATRRAQPRLGRAGRGLVVCREDHRSFPLHRDSLRREVPSGELRAAAGCPLTCR
jgi:uncharacterized protein YijF (DUF1287 family)